MAELPGLDFAAGVRRRRLPLALGNRHGLIASTTGTGSTLGTQIGHNLGKSLGGSVDATLGSSIDRAVVRGILGSILGGR